MYVYLSFYVYIAFYVLYILRVSYQNGVSLLHIMLEINHSGREPSICCIAFMYVVLQLCVMPFLYVCCLLYYELGFSSV